MNAPTTILVPLTVNDAHILRSRLLDAFANVEEQVARISAMSPKKVSETACLGQRIEAANAVQPSPQMSKDKHRTMLSVLSGLASLLPVRNDIVHAKLRLATVDAQPTLILRNARIEDEYPLMRLIDLAQMEDLIAQVERMAHQLSAALNQPSPPQPKPDAAAGP